MFRAYEGGRTPTLSRDTQRELEAGCSALSGSAAWVALPRVEREIRESVRAATRAAKHAVLDALRLTRLRGHRRVVDATPVHDRSFPREWLLSRSR